MPPKEKAILVALDLKDKRKTWTTQDSISELELLADTAGAEIVEKIIQSKDQPDPRYYIGSGKVSEIHKLVQIHNADMIIMDESISPSQQRNLEEEIGVRVIDRTALIIDIFAQHAKSREGKVQVELARWQYMLPRLAGLWEHLPRQRGGIGLRDVGEKQIELDRRIIKNRIQDLKKEIEGIRQSRATQRKQRVGNAVPSVVLVGYTNAGKSTLLSALTGESVYIADQLFATLDPLTRRLKLESGQEIVLSDTVGFIQKLPLHLVDAFKTTLEEVTYADFLLHVVDASHPKMEEQISAVYRVLEELGAAAKPMITVFNKIDKGPGASSQGPTGKLSKLTTSVQVSALKKTNLDKLLEAITEQVKELMVNLDFKIPLNRMELVSLLHEKGKVHAEKYTSKNVMLNADVDHLLAKKMERFIKE